MRGASGGRSDRRSADVPPMRDLVDAALAALRRAEPRWAEPPRAGGREVPRRADLGAVHDLAQRRIESDIATAWTRGWQPAEVARHARRTGSAAGARLVLVAIAADHAVRDPSTLDPRWAGQIHALDLPAVDLDDGWVRRWSAVEQLEPAEDVNAVLELAAMLAHLPRLDQLIPPPGAGADWAVQGARGGGGSTFGRGAATDDGGERDPVLEKVRALLAKAESTTFEAEAEAFTAKAQELIARHAIDVAVLAVGDDTDCPTAIRIPIDDPYVDAKSVLLHVVAQSGRCRAAFHPSLALSTVVGFASDIAGVEMMFTSLLVQATAAMAATARAAPPGSRARSRGFRSAFLQSYATRIGQRLDEINAEMVAETDAERAASVLPVLLSREQAVDDALQDLMGTLTTRRSRGGVDAAGWASGAFAADNAQLGGGFVEGGG